MTHQEFEHIAELLRSQLLHIGRNFFGDNDCAEDVAQEILMRIWLMRERVHTPTVAALAVQMAKNYCVSEWRRRKAKPTVVADDSILTHQEPSDRLEVQEEERRLIQAVSHLSRAEQRLFRMRYELEMDIPQISAATGIQPRSVSAMLSAAKKKVVERMKKGERT